MKILLVILLFCSSVFTISEIDQPTLEEEALVICSFGIIQAIEQTNGFFSGLEDGDQKSNEETSDFMTRISTILEACNTFKNAHNIGNYFEQTAIGYLQNVESLNNYFQAKRKDSKIESGWYKEQVRFLKMSLDKASSALKGDF